MTAKLAQPCARCGEPAEWAEAGAGPQLAAVNGTDVGPDRPVCGWCTCGTPWWTWPASWVLYLGMRAASLWTRLTRREAPS
jgi:hypothetical protein